jgi:sigma-B regulation protein RsbU (phosphoserine phosphatase)
MVVQTLAFERMEKELLVAGEIQNTMLPQHMPELPGWQLSVALEPARETSGDFYDFIPLSNGRIGLIVADVADKGVGAALYMALSRTLIRVFARDYDDPAQALAAANQHILSDTNSDQFVTVIYIVLDPANGQLTYCNAGHPPAFILSTNGDPPQALTRTGLPLGILDDIPWQQGVGHMQLGDVLVLYTDGVTEAEDEMADFFGEKRLQAIIKKFINRSPAIIEDKILTTIYDFMGEAPQHDDITLMIVSRESMSKN